jgi:hypothetical protein
MAGFEVLAASSMDIKVFWNMMPCRLLVTYCFLVGKGDFCHSKKFPRNPRDLSLFLGLPPWRQQSVPER